MAQARVVVMIPPARVAEVLEPAALDRLQELAEIVPVTGTTATIAAALPELLAEADIVLTSWGTPPITETALSGAPRLRLIAHAAGSIKHLVPATAFVRGIAVSHAASIIADAVAEMALLLILACLRDLRRLDRDMHAGRPWGDLPTGYTSRQLVGRSLGLIGSGYVARTFLGLLQPFGLTVRVYDPYLKPERAAELGVRLAGLDELFELSDIVSVHAPITPETRHLIGANQLRRLRDGAVFINTARAWAVDQAALLAELQTGRIMAGLDVYEPEPLPGDSPFRQLDNVILTPHQAGNTADTRRRQGWAMVEEIGRFVSSQALIYRITPDQYSIMA